MKHDLVPDSITPVEGWKMFNLIGPYLHSPNFPLLWSPRKPAEATCVQNHFEYHWVPTSKPPQPVPTFPNNAVAAAFLSSTPPHPKTILPRGKHWVLKKEEIEHYAPSHECACGIHIAKDIELAAGYGAYLGKMKGWGRVVEHVSGWRVQYAYPSELYAYTPKDAIVLSAYGVPVTLFEDVEDEEIRNVLQEQLAVSEASATRTIFGMPAWLAPGILAGLTVSQGALMVLDPNVLNAFVFGVVAAATGFTANRYE